MRNTGQTNWDYESIGKIDSILDVGPIVVSHHTNPVQEKMVDFLSKIFTDEIKILIPLTTFLGAYHILTRYLKVSRHAKTLGTRNIYTIDKKLKKVQEMSIISPLSDKAMDQYHSWLKEKMAGK